MKTYLNQLVFDVNEFDHFLTGDGEFYYDEDSGRLVSKAEVETYLKEDCDCKCEKEAQEILDEQHIYKSYKDLCSVYDYHDDDGWAIDYIGVGDKFIVMSLAQN